MSKYYLARNTLYSSLTNLINISIFSLERQQVIVPGRRAMATGVHPSVTAARMQEVGDFVVCLSFCQHFVVCLSLRQHFVFVVCLSFRQHFVV